MLPGARPRRNAKHRRTEQARRDRLAASRLAARKSRNYPLSSVDFWNAEGIRLSLRLVYDGRPERDYASGTGPATARRWGSPAFTYLTPQRPWYDQDVVQSMRFKQYKRLVNFYANKHRKSTYDGYARRAHWKALRMRRRHIERGDLDHPPMQGEHLSRSPQPR